MCSEMYSSDSPDCPAGPVPRSAILGTAIVLGALSALTVWGEYSSHTRGELLLVDGVLALICCCLLPYFFRYPVYGAVVLALMAGISPAVTPLATMGTFYVSQRRRLSTALTVALVGIGAHVLRGLWRPFDSISFTWWVILVVVAHIAVVAWGALIASLRERAVRAEAEQGRRIAEERAMERNRIAREMHDVLAHRLSLIATYAGALEYRPDSRPERLAEAASIIRLGVHEALDELRDVIAVLREDEGGDEQRPQPSWADVPSLIGESAAAGMLVDVNDQIAQAERPPPPTTGRTAYRVIQEGLTNARKHAPGIGVRVVLTGTPGDFLRIDITNSLPADPVIAGVVPGSGMGLVGLTERVRLAGGRLDHRLRAGDVFELRAELPW